MTTKNDKAPKAPPDPVRFAIVKIAKFYETLSDEQRGRVKAALDAMFPSGTDGVK